MQQQQEPLIYLKSFLQLIGLSIQRRKSFELGLYNIRPLLPSDFISAKYQQCGSDAVGAGLTVTLMPEALVVYSAA